MKSGAVWHVEQLATPLKSSSPRCAASEIEPSEFLNRLVGARTRLDMNAVTSAAASLFNLPPPRRGGRTPPS